MQTVAHKIYHRQQLSLCINLLLHRHQRSSTRQLSCIGVGAVWVLYSTVSENTQQINRYTSCLTVELIS